MSTFRTRARAVDMLGRQQIAGVPNAISELCKNAHDAYADHVEIDYFYSDRLLVLRDDGIGMSPQEFKERWLVLGTESKLGAQGGIQLPPRDPNKPERPISGEKGIGRLAIAAIGPQVFVFTRAGQAERDYNLVAAFIHWGFFELPGINLDEIDIPVEPFPGGTFPSAIDLKAMVNQVRENLTRLKSRIDPVRARHIRNDLDSLDLDDLVRTAKFLATQDNQLTLEGSGRGTQFYIPQVIDTLSDDILLDSQEKEEISRLRRLLLGFTDTMTKCDAPVVKISFRYWLTDNVPRSYLEAAEFWTPHDLERADHRFSGHFDEFGTFRGTVRVYDQETLNYELPWPTSQGIATACGPFEIDIGFIQGKQRESRLPPDEFSLLYRKAARIGGIYIYRDGIRVLPYGDVDFDWLEIEKRRNLGAGYYFFSYRRMFGAINVTRELNTNLHEKAGREGFRENKAYRQFKAILINFLIQLAGEFFRKDAPREQIYRQRQAELKRKQLAREEAEKHAERVRRNFARDLDRGFDRINDAAPQRKVAALLSSAERELQSVTTQGGVDLLGNNLLLEQEVALLNKLDTIRDSLKIDQPEGVGLSQELGRDWLAYAEELDRLDKEVFAPAERKIQQIVTEYAQKADVTLDPQERIQCLIDSTIQTATASVINAVAATRTDLEDVIRRVNDLADQFLGETKSLANQIEAELQQIDLDQLSGDEVEQRRLHWEQRVEATAWKNQQFLNHVRTQLKEVDWKVVEGQLIGTAEMHAAVEEEMLALREQADVNLELSQLGMAIEIINHEFNNTIRAIRANILELKSWADANSKLEPVYRNLRDSFEHLDSYLNLFTPLHRRLYRQAIEIKGSSIATFLQNLFNNRFIQNDIHLIASQAFKDKIIIGYPSTFYPVFVNLVDNSVFWLENHQKPREIHLDLDPAGLVIWDTGPGIPSRDREAVFEMGFTRKPGGRGLGLYIAKQVLNREGFDLELSQPIKGQGAWFKIVPVETREEE